MAELDLSELNEKEIDALQSAINRKKRMKVDWDNMTDEERAYRNKTIEPRTHKTQHFEYPKTIYGNINGTVQAAIVANKAEEAELRRSYPDAEWDKTMLDHGIETCPSKPSGAVRAGFVMVGAAATNPAVAVTTRDDTTPPIPELPRRGRPRKQPEAA